MKRIYGKSAIHALLASIVFTFAGAASASQSIAHRGLYHDQSSNYDLVENSYDAVYRAFKSGLAGAEIDLRLSSDGDLMVTHDHVSARTTEDDATGGKWNPINSPGTSPPALRSIDSASFSHWTNIRLKSYRSGGVLSFTPQVYMIDLNTMLRLLRNNGVFGSNFGANRGFKLILDIQNPQVFSAAAAAVKNAGVQRNVYLKFFVSQAVSGSEGLTYNGADTCYQYMLRNQLNDPNLQIIPQINDGELEYSEDDEYGIKAFGRTLSIPEYLNCWANARAQHSNVAYMPIVSASVPSNNINATNAAKAALTWARANGRQTMSIVPNPDAARRDSHGTCNLYSFSAGNASVFPFNMNARNAKTNFASSQNVDYLVIDMMGNGGGGASGSLGTYLSGICN